MENNYVFDPPGVRMKRLQG